MTKARYVIGIDLGTTHSVLSYKKLTDYQKQADIFLVDQLIGPGEIARKPLLPSFRYHYNIDEIATADLVLPWQTNQVAGDINEVIIGEWARELGSKTQGRLLTSAKSWLSHQSVDPQAAILPWSADESIAKVSPVTASASYLNHFQQSWNYHNPDNLLADQHITITVPASFNDSARALTLAAAELAGLTKVTLLEEPQAVCYDWYHRNKKQNLDLIQQDQTMLVCDIGGGTTDLSLIEMALKDGELQLNRVAVGEHLMLGGDNIDLALAHTVEQRISPNQRLAAASLGQVIQQTRKAKELFLSAQPPSKTSITLLGRGSKLIAKAKTCELTKNEVTDMVFSGFLPLSEFNQQPRHRQNAVVEFGLPYTSDPAISKHVAEFIQNYYNVTTNETEEVSQLIPSALLVNGGIFNSPLVKQQVEKLLAQWKSAPIQMLHNGDPDLSVAYGAVEFGFARLGKQQQIGGGSPRNYFIDIVDRAGKTQSICLLPKGTAEDAEIKLSSRLFSLTMGEPIKFNLSTTNHESKLAAGDIVTETLQGNTPLPPFVVTIPKHGQQRFESVYLACQLSSVGTLKIDCVSENDPNQRWALEFSIRENNLAKNNAEQNIADIKPTHPKLQDAITLIENVYGASSKKADPKRVKSLRTDLDKQLGKRENWDTDLLRELANPCLTWAKNRRRTEVHERNWLKLTSFLLRPGFGYPADDWRVEQIWPLFKSAIQYNKSTQSWSDWWNFWRRIAGGLNAQQQEEIFAAIKIYFVADNNKNAKLINQAKQRSYEDIIRLAASLEHISINNKVAFGEFLLERLDKPANQQVHWWALGRLGSRIAFYGSQHNVIPVHIISNWLEKLWHQDWQMDPHVGFAAAMMARRSGDREFDIDEELQQVIIAKLVEEKCPSSWTDLIRKKQVTDETMIKRIFGDSLPTGLTLLS